MPADIVRIVGKTHINRTLGTAAFPDALARCRIVTLEVANWFEEVRAGGVCALPSAATVQTQAGPTNFAAPGHNLTIAEAWKLYLRDPGSTRTRKTVLAYETVQNLVISVLGRETPVAKIGRQECRRVLDTLRYLPANFAKKWPDLPAIAIAEMSRRDGLTPMAAANCNGYMTRWAGMMNWLVKEELLDRNPCVGLRVADPVAVRDKRRPFSSEQLGRIFTGQPFEELQLGRIGKWNLDSPSHFHVPLIALYSGLRQNEICQQTVDDIAEIEGVQCFVVKADTSRGQRIKTASAERVVPVHPALIRAGLLVHHGRQCAAGETRLWPELRLDRFGYASAYFSKWFARYLDRVGAREFRTSFHSFRHCFRDALRAAGVDREMAFALGGWSGSRSGSIAVGDAYGSGFPIGALREAICRVNYDVSALSSLLEGSIISPSSSCAAVDL